MEVLGTTRYYVFRHSAGFENQDAEGKTGSMLCYGEYSQAFACRLFAVTSERVAVAPYDMAFIEAYSMSEPPPGEDVRETSLHEFEEQWEHVAQPRLQILARQRIAPVTSMQVLYVKMPFPDTFKYNEPSSDLYTEWVNAVARRHFEVFPDHVVVATHDPEAGWPEHFEAVERAIELGLDDAGKPIDPLLQPIALSHAAFEEIWERYALKRLHTLAGLPVS